MPHLHKMAGSGFGGFSLGKRKEGSYGSYGYYGDNDNKKKHYKTEDE